MINWGHRGGATPARLIATICRRGDITSRSIGALRIERGGTRFEIRSDIADEFARKVAEPDPRDPKLEIRRA